VVAAELGGGWCNVWRSIATSLATACSVRSAAAVQARLGFVRTQELLSRLFAAPPAIVVDVEHGVGARRIVVM
jgi:hypothetical protein